MLTVSELFIYPIKSCGGISVTTATVTDRGFLYDRRWMLVDEDRKAITQRECPKLALLQVSFISDGLKIYHKKDPEICIIVPFEPETCKLATVEIFEEPCEGQLVSTKADEWFSKVLSIRCSLVYMADNIIRKVDERYAINNDITSFSDGYPYLIIGQASLDDLNRKLTEPLPINRFRPNIVFTGGDPHEEDLMKSFTINGIHFYGVKLCGRCVITTINQDDACKSKEPLKTMTTYRSRNNKIYFGQNLLIKGKGNINVGDSINVLQLNSL